MGEIAIVNIGLGNISSIQKVLQTIGYDAHLVGDASLLDKYRKIILPGVGHFDEGVRRLDANGFLGALSMAISQDAHILGICLGMQLLCHNSEEGKLPGLGLIDADVKKFRFAPESKLKVPQMGWNVVSTARENPLLPVNTEEQRFYFVHSYKVVPADSAITIGTANYGEEFCAAFQQGNVFGVQFHPEKSHRFGMELMRRFVEL